MIFRDKLLVWGFMILIFWLVIYDNSIGELNNGLDNNGLKNGLRISSGRCCSQIGGGNDGLELVDEEGLVDDYHVIASGQCNFYQDWQMAVLWWSLRRNWRNVAFSRLLNCGQDERKKYRYGSLMPTVWAPDWSQHPKTGDKYAPYNKPVGVLEFLKSGSGDLGGGSGIREKWIVIVDPDQIIKKPMDNLNPEKGRPVAQLVTFPMKDLDKIVNYLGMKMSDVDKVSVPIIIHQNDLRRVAPLWLKYTEMIRQDAKLKVWGEWIAEMYGYIIACGKLGLKHQLRQDLGDRIPYNVKNSYSLHYDLEHVSKDKKIKWNKRSYMNSDVLAGAGLPMPVFPRENSPTDDFASVTATINRALEEIRGN